MRHWLRRLQTIPNRGGQRRFAIFFNSLLINGAIFLFCLPVLVLMALFFTSYYETDWRAFKVTAWLQLAFALTVPFLLFADFPLGHAIGAPMIAAALLGFSAVLIVAFGLLTFPVVFFSLHRPANWRRSNGLILAGYFIVAVLGYAIVEGHRVARLRVPPPAIPTDFNLVFYGQVLEADGRPAGGAFVTLDGCDYYARKIVQVDDDGIFEVRAQCANALSISQIRNFSNSWPCINSDGSGQPGGPLARITLNGPQVAEEDELNRGGYSREKPYRIVCTWDWRRHQRPGESSKKSPAPTAQPPASNPIVKSIPTPQVKDDRLRIDAHWFATSMIADGRLYTMVLESAIPAQFGLVEGDHRGWLQVRYQRVGEVDPASGQRSSGYLKLLAVGEGGLLPVGDSGGEDFPAGEYRETVEFELGGDSGRQVIACRFVAERGRVAGELRIYHSMTARNQTLRFRVEATGGLGYSGN